MSDLKRFNLGFGVIGPREYCTSGRYVEADEAIRREALLLESLGGIKESEKRWHVVTLRQDKAIQEFKNEIASLNFRLHDAVIAQDANKKLAWLGFGLFAVALTVFGFILGFRA